MPISYRLVDSNGEVLSSAATIEELKGSLAHLEAGRYMVDQITADVLGLGLTAKRWDIMFRLEDGVIAADFELWDD
jgi:hypothetical protein